MNTGKVTFREGAKDTVLRSFSQWEPHHWVFCVMWGQVFKSVNVTSNPFWMGPGGVGCEYLLPWQSYADPEFSVFLQPLKVIHQRPLSVPHMVAVTAGGFPSTVPPPDVQHRVILIQHRFDRHDLVIPKDNLRPSSVVPFTHQSQHIS